VHTLRGYETVLQLAIHHARVYMGARSETKARAAIERIRKDPRTTDPDVHFLKLDLADLKNVVEAAKQIQKCVVSTYSKVYIRCSFDKITWLYRREEYIHGLVNNAGIMATPYELTVDGYESQFQVHLSCRSLEINCYFFHD
jgi:NAD(P)-dependent dehydrogenase (short-subunit alcohol dehydrogenase family)